MESWMDGGLAGALSVGALTAARVAPLSVVAPFFAFRNVGAPLRAALVLTLSVAFAPTAALHVAEPWPEGMLLVGWMLREALVGLLFAFAASIPFYGLDFGGRLVDTWRGASLAEVIAPPTGERTSPLGDLYLMLGVALFLGLGGHRLALSVFAESLATVPVGAAVDFGQSGFVLGAARLSAWGLAFGLAVAAPAGLCIVLTELALGLVGRAAPALPLFFAGMPLRAAMGIVGALLGFSAVLALLPEAFRQALEASASLVRAVLP